VRALPVEDAERRRRISGRLPWGRCPAGPPGDNIWMSEVSPDPGGAFPHSASSVEIGDMPNDAKVGLVVGVGLVITIAVVFFHKDLITRRPGTDPAASTVGPAKAPAVPRGMPRPTRARTASQTEPAGAYRQVLQEGDMQEPAGEVRQPTPAGGP